MNHFTVENTPGYDQNILDEMNKYADNIIDYPLRFDSYIDTIVPFDVERWGEYENKLDEIEEYFKKEVIN